MSLPNAFVEILTNKARIHAWRESNSPTKYRTSTHRFLAILFASPRPGTFHVIQQSSTMKILKSRRAFFSQRIKIMATLITSSSLCILSVLSFPILQIHHTMRSGFGIASPRDSLSLLATSSSSSSDTNNKSDSKGADLLQRLDDNFQYDGRLPMKEGFRCGFVSILGAPNMGKSTLVNAVLKADLCIATRRPQTTRHAILGVLTTADTQLCLIDTPGIIEDPAYKLQEGMMEAVKGAFYDSDALLIVTDLFSTPIPDDKIFERVISSKLPVIVVINKIDLVGKANPDKVDDDNGSDGKTYSVPQSVVRWRALLPNAMAIIPVAASEGPDNEGKWY